MTEPISRFAAAQQLQKQLEHLIRKADDLHEYVASAYLSHALDSLTDRDITGSSPALRR